jgi:hypothetical protein
MHRRVWHEEMWWEAESLLRFRAVGARFLVVEWDEEDCCWRHGWEDASLVSIPYATRGEAMRWVRDFLDRYDTMRKKKGSGS